MGQAGKPPKDAVGNTILEGDFLHLRMDDPWIIVRVVQQDNGGLIVPVATIGDRQAGAPPGMQMPGKMIALAEIPIIYEPGGKIGVVLKIEKPPGTKELKKPDQPVPDLVKPN